MEPSPKSSTKTSIATSQEYTDRLADISSRASLTDPLNILFQHDIHGPSNPLTLQNLYTTTLSRIQQKTASGSSIIEANDFAAVACLEPPSSGAVDLTEEELLEMEKERPVYARYNRQVEALRREALGEQRFWQMSLLARDPERDGKGAVRAIIGELLRRTGEDGVGVWCVAGNERARGVYEFFGFREVGVVELGEGVRAWCMVWRREIR